MLLFGFILNSIWWGWNRAIFCHEIGSANDIAQKAFHASQVYRASSDMMTSLSFSHKLQINKSDLQWTSPQPGQVVISCDAAISKVGRSSRNLW